MSFLLHCQQINGLKLHLSGSYFSQAERKKMHVEVQQEQPRDLVYEWSNSFAFHWFMLNYLSFI